jgi:hypothetical protein
MLRRVHAKLYDTQAIKSIAHIPQRREYALFVRYARKIDQS